MTILNLILPVFAVIITGWLCAYFKVFNDELAKYLIQFALYVSMPALLFVTIATEHFSTIFNWGFIISYGGGTLLVFIAIFLVCFFYAKWSMARSAIAALAGSMTNIGFVALPILLALFGPPGVLPAAIATVLVAVILFPLGIFLVEADKNKSQKIWHSILQTFKTTLGNPMVLATLAGMIYSLIGLPIPVLLHNYLNIFASALTPCALFAVGLGMSLRSIHTHRKEVIWLTVIKLFVLPFVVFLMAWALHLSPFFAIAAVIASAVPTAKTTYILAAEYNIGREAVAATISITTLLSVVTLVLLLIIFSHLWPSAFVHTGGVLAG